MSVRIGTPAASHAARASRPASSPGPRNEPAEVRFALSYDALKIKWTPARPAMSRSAAATHRMPSLSITQGPGDQEQRRATARPRPATGSASTPANLPRTRRGCGARPPCAVAGAGRTGEERVGLQRLRLELRVELHRHYQGWVGYLHDLDELAVGRTADDLSPLSVEGLLVQAVELVAVAVPLVDYVCAVELARPRARASARRRRCRGAWCRPGRRRRAGRAACK